MTNPAKKHDRIKLAVIPVLGAVLFALLPGGSNDQTSAGPVELIVPDAPVGKKHSTERQRVEWPRHSLTSIVAHNPFHLSDPRVALDRAMYENGITAVEEMAEVPLDEFLKDARENQTDLLDAATIAAEEDFLNELMESLSEPDNDVAPSETTLAESTQATDHAAKTILATEESNPGPSADDIAAELHHLRQRLVQLKSQPVTMFMQTQSGNSVLVGDRRIAEGEFVEAGILAKVIDRNGITFEINKVTDATVTESN